MPQTRGRMKYNPHSKSAFLLTPTEKKVLEMKRMGMKHKEIAAALGRKGGDVSYAIEVAAMKEQVLTNDHRAPEGHTRLGVARGQKRMKRT